MIYGREALVLGAVMVGAILVGGQTAKREWTLEKSGTPGAVHFTVKQMKYGSSSSWGNDVPAASLQNFTVGSPDRGGPVKFEYKQDAGSLLCEGRMFWGRGSGTWTFRPNPQFVSSLQQLGYLAPGDDQLFSLMQSGVTLAFARGVKEVGLGASTSELLDLRNHGITLDYLREGRAAGYPGLSARDYMDLKSHGVSMDFLRDLRSAGYHFNTGDLVELRSRGVPAEFAADLKNAGYDLSASKIAELRSHGIGSDFVRQLQRDGLRPAADELVQFRDRGVDPAYLKGLKDAGLDQLPAQDITDLRAHGVNTPFVRASAELGYRFGARELIDLQAHGVNEEYLRNLQAAGMKNLTAEQIVKLRVHGVD